MGVGVTEARPGGRSVDLRFQPDPSVEVQAQPPTENPTRLGRKPRRTVRAPAQRVIGVEEVTPAKDAEIEAELRRFVFAWESIAGFGSGSLPAHQQDQSAQGERATTKPSLRGLVHQDNLRSRSKGHTSRTPTPRRNIASIGELFAFC